MTRQEVFLDRLARLCRSPGARYPQVASCTTNSEGTRRTCIDAGRDLMLTCQITYPDGAVTMATATASPHPTAANARIWHRDALDGVSSTGESLIFGKPTPSDWPLARRHLRQQEAVMPHLMELLARGTIYMATRQEPGTGRDWLSVALNRLMSPREALAALGLTNVWGPLQTCVSDLAGRRVRDNARPWSLALSPPLQTRPAGLRAGTTLWARLPEDIIKRRRFADQIDAMGGPGARMNGVYDFIAGQSIKPRGVGVAAEFDFNLNDQRLTGAHYTFRVPALTPTAPPVLETQNG